MSRTVRTLSSIATGRVVGRLVPWALALLATLATASAQDVTLLTDRKSVV